MRRRDVIALMASDARLVLPFAARAPSRSVPVVSSLDSGSQLAFAGLAGAFRQGLGARGLLISADPFLTEVIK